MAVLSIDDAAFADVLAQNPNVVVKYYADWCGSCKLFGPKFRRLSEDAAYDGVTFIEVNAEHNPEARKAGGVNNLPFLAAFHKGQRIAGASTSKEEVAKEFLSQLQTATA